MLCQNPSVKCHRSSDTDMMMILAWMRMSVWLTKCYIRPRQSPPATIPQSTNPSTHIHSKSTVLRKSCIHLMLTTITKHPRRHRLQRQIRFTLRSFKHRKRHRLHPTFPSWDGHLNSRRSQQDLRTYPVVHRLDVSRTSLHWANPPRRLRFPLQPLGNPVQQRLGCVRSIFHDTLRNTRVARSARTACGISGRWTVI